MLLSTLTNQIIILDLINLLNCTILLVATFFFTSKAEHMHTHKCP